MNGRHLLLLIGLVALLAGGLLLLTDGDAPEDVFDSSVDRGTPGPESAPGPTDLGVTGEPAEPPATTTADPDRSEAEEQPVDEEIRRTVSLSGTVRDESDRPVAGVAIMVFRPGYRGIGGTVVGQALTDEAGGYTLRVPRNIPLRVEASAVGYQRRRIDMKPSGGAGHDLRLEAETPLSDGG